MVSGREITINKSSKDTKLRLLYMNNLRVTGNGASCSWEIKVDGQSCPSGIIRGDRHVAGSENTHRFHAIIGYCDNLSAGSHKIQAYVSQLGSSADCYTGWADGSSWTLMSEEEDHTKTPPSPTYLAA